MFEQQRLSPDVFGQGLNQQVFGHGRTFQGRGGRKATTQRNTMPFSPMLRNHTKSKALQMNNPANSNNNNNTTRIYNDKNKRNHQEDILSNTNGITAADRAARFGTTSKTAIYDNVSKFPNSFFPSLYM